MSLLRFMYLIFELYVKGRVPKKIANYPHFVDKGGGVLECGKAMEGVGGRRMWITKFLNVNIFKGPAINKFMPLVVII